MTDIPVIFDSRYGEYRPITQAEVDELCRVKAAYGNLRLMSQSILSESQKIAVGRPHQDAERDLASYMLGEDVRQGAEFEQRMERAMARYDDDEALDAILDEIDAEVAKQPFPRYGSFAEQAEHELRERTTRTDTSGDHLRSS